MSWRDCGRPVGWLELGLGRWARAPTEIVLDFDASLITAHSEKEGAAGNYKGGFGFHPLFCYLDQSGEALAGLLRPGDADPGPYRQRRSQP